MLNHSDLNNKNTIGLVSALNCFLSLKTFFFGGNGHYSVIHDKEKLSFRLSWPTLLWILQQKGLPVNGKRGLKNLVNSGADSEQGRYFILLHHFVHFIIGRAF
jgi:hypothetical protein